MFGSKGNEMTIYIILYITNIIAGIVFIPYFKKGKTLYMLFTFLQLALLGGFRGITVGTDTAAYHDIFYKVQETNTLKGLWEIREEFGYVLLNKLVAILGGGPQLVMFVTSAFIAGGFLIFITHNSDDIFFSVLLLLSLMLYFTSFNGIRQYMATVVLLNAYIFLKRKKLLPYLILCVLAISFHKTALLFVPFYFINLVKWNQRRVIILLITIFVLTAFSSLLIDLVVKILPQYRHYLDTRYFQATNGIMMPVVFFSIFAFVAFIFFVAKPYKDKDFVNMFIFFGFLLFLTVVGVTSSSIANRLGWYLSPYLIVLIPKSLKYLPATAKTISTLGIGVMGFAYFIYCLSIEWNRVVPYIFYWNM